ncbi:MAG: peptide-methionine (R)-S-oxide reductase, partial [Phycisphaerales bacterium]|nr:peptide-methionine (R)-S-oxide reductase [Phycisphaerales bacterium]
MPSEPNARLKGSCGDLCHDHALQSTNGHEPPRHLSLPARGAAARRLRNQQRTSTESTRHEHQYDHSRNPYYSHTDTTKLNVPLSEWKKLLPEDLYYIAFEKGTERAFTGKYWDFEGIGTYACAVCGNVLFQADSKFASSCGWPSFFQPE